MMSLENGTDEAIRRTGTERQMWRTDWMVRGAGKGRVRQMERAALTHGLPCKIASGKLLIAQEAQFSALG